MVPVASSFLATPIPPLSSSSSQPAHRLAHRLPGSSFLLVSKRTRRWVAFAQLNENPSDREKGDNLNGDSNGNRQPSIRFRWKDLLDPDPDNILAVALTGLLTWASVQVLWQLFFISIAILVAALKYSFVAALLLFILITLL